MGIDKHFGLKGPAGTSGLVPQGKGGAVKRQFPPYPGSIKGGHGKEAPVVNWSGMKACPVHRNPLKGEQDPASGSYMPVYLIKRPFVQFTGASQDN
jgi:hypothetical protein